MESTPSRTALLPQKVGANQAPEVRTASAGDVASDAAVPSVTSRQFQFSTPGGTRIVWVLNPDYLNSGSADHPVDWTEL